MKVVDPTKGHAESAAPSSIVEGSKIVGAAASTVRHGEEKRIWIVIDQGSHDDGRFPDDPLWSSEAGERIRIVIDRGRRTEGRFPDDPLWMTKGEE